MKISKIIDGFIYSDKYYKTFIVISILMVLSYKFLDSRIINIPDSIYVFLILIISVFLYHIFKKELTFFNIIKGFFVSYIIFYVFIYSIFILASIHYSKNQYTETHDCEITSVSYSSRNKAIYYKFNENTYRIGTKINASLRNQPENYRLKLTTRKGLMGSYIIKKIQVASK